MKRMEVMQRKQYCTLKNLVKKIGNIFVFEQIKIIIIVSHSASSSSLSASFVASLQVHSARLCLGTSEEMYSLKFKYFCFCCCRKYVVWPCASPPAPPAASRRPPGEGSNLKKQLWEMRTFMELQFNNLNFTRSLLMPSSTEATDSCSILTGKKITETQ